MTLHILTTDQVLCHGLELVGFDKKRQGKVQRKKNRSRFRTHYGSEPDVYAHLFGLLQTTEIKEAGIQEHFDYVGIDKTIDYFFGAIYMLAKYPTEEEAEGVFGWSDRTWSKWVWKIIVNISSLKTEVVVWPESWNNPDSEKDDQTIFIVTVDGAHFRILEPKHEDFSENTIFYSHKFKQAALDYEIACAIFGDDVGCIWAVGPYPAGVNDITVFRKENGLKDKILEARKRSGVNHRAIGDKGYRGERDVLSVPSSHDTEEVRDFKGRAMSRQETFNARMKNFDCLDERFRHSIEKHCQCFNAVLVICQLQIENGSPLFRV